MHLPSSILLKMPKKELCKQKQRKKTKRLQQCCCILGLMFELNGNARLTMTMITCSVTISVTLHAITSQLAPKSRYESEANVQSLNIVFFKNLQVLQILS